MPIKLSKLIKSLIALTLIFFLTACGGGGSSSGGSNADLAVWLGSYSLVLTRLNTCPSGRSHGSGTAQLNQNGSEISGSYKFTRILCIGSIPFDTTPISGSLRSTSISKSELVVIDNEGDAFTFTQGNNQSFRGGTFTIKNAQGVVGASGNWSVK